MMVHMSTAIALHGVKNVILRNVWISGFKKGVEAVNSNLLLGGVYIQRSGIGLDLVNSYATIHDSRFIENAIDIVVNKSTAFIINTVASKIVEILPKGDYRVNPYMVQSIAYEIISTSDVQRKRSLLRKLLRYLNYVGYGLTVYQILKEFFSYLR